MWAPNISEVLSLMIFIREKGRTAFKNIQVEVMKSIGVVCRGTLPYMAPELVSDPERVSEKADVWSLGMVLWEMLTRQVPFTHLTPQQIIAGLMVGNLQPEVCLPICLTSFLPTVPREFLSLSQSSGVSVVCGVTAGLFTLVCACTGT